MFLGCVSVIFCGSLCVLVAVVICFANFSQHRSGKENWHQIGQTIGAYLVLFFFKIGFPSWCKICAHVVLFKLENCAFFWCKMCAHLVLFSFKIVLLAGATFVTFWHIRCSQAILLTLSKMLKYRSYVRFLGKGFRV